MSDRITGTAWDHGSKGSIGTTALQLTSSQLTLARGITIKADVDNSGVVQVGRSDVTHGVSAPATDGFKLAAGEEVFIEASDPTQVYVISADAGQAVTWIAM